ncbi:MAG: ArdC family protein [Candidatus Competibacteraceae bacterium]
MEQGYAAPFWMTYRQAQALGGQGPSGEHGSMVVYANAIHKTEIDRATRSGGGRDSLHEGLQRCSTWNRSMVCPTVTMRRCRAGPVRRRA